MSIQRGVVVLVATVALIFSATVVFAQGEPLRAPGNETSTWAPVPR